MTTARKILALGPGLLSLRVPIVDKESGERVLVKINPSQWFSIVHDMLQTNPSLVIEVIYDTL
jgi:hypothetical protein